MQARQSQLYTVTMRGSLPCDTEILLPQSLALEFGCDSYVVCKQNCACAFIPKYVCMSLPSLLIRTSLNGNDGQKLLAVLWAMSKKKKTKKNPSLVPTVDLAFPCFLCLPLYLSIHVFVQLGRWTCKSFGCGSGRVDDQTAADYVRSTRRY